MLTLLPRDCIIEILSHLKVRDCVRLLSCCTYFYDLMPYIQKRVLKCKLRHHLRVNILPKQKYYAGLLGRMRAWRLYLPHKYEFDSLDVSSKFYHKSFEAFNFIDTIPLRVDLIHKVIFSQYYYKIALFFNNTYLFTKYVAKELVLTLPVNKISKNNILKIQCYDENDKVVYPNFKIVYGILDPYRKEMIERTGCIEINLENHTFIITTAGDIVQINI